MNCWLSCAYMEKYKYLWEIPYILFMHLLTSTDKLNEQDRNKSVSYS